MTDTEIIDWLCDKELWFADSGRTRCCSISDMPMPGRAQPLGLREYVELLASSDHIE